MAQAETIPNPTIYQVSPNVRLSPDAQTAYVWVNYRCYGGQPTHAWISVKQGPNVSAPNHLGGADASAWYDTNWVYGQDPNGQTLTCDGTRQHQLFVLKPEPVNPYGFSGSTTLTKGTAYVQVCLYESSGLSQPEGSTVGYAGDMTFRHVQLSHLRHALQRRAPHRT